MNNKTIKGLVYGSSVTPGIIEQNFIDKLSAMGSRVVEQLHQQQSQIDYRLKRVSAKDHEFLVELHNDPDVLVNLTDPKPITMKSHLEWWNTRSPTNEAYFLFCVNGTNVGFTKFRPIDHENKNVVLGADIHKDYRGNGYAKYMWDLMLEYSFVTLGMHRASLVTAEYNQRARKVYERLGFTEEGRNIQALRRECRYHDAICMYMLYKDWPSYKL